jgi:uncharacterized protein
VLELRDIIWKMQFVEKLQIAHAVATEEVESVLFGFPHLLRVRRGRVKGEDVYEAFGQTAGGRYLVVFFIHKTGAALPISARDMTQTERRYYEQHKR